MFCLALALAWRTTVLGDGCEDRPAAALFPFGAEKEKAIFLPFSASRKNHVRKESKFLFEEPLSVRRNPAENLTISPLNSDVGQSLKEEVILGSKPRQCK